MIWSVGAKALGREHGMVQEPHVRQPRVRHGGGDRRRARDARGVRLPLADPGVTTCSTREHKSSSPTRTPCSSRCELSENALCLLSVLPASRTATAPVSSDPNARISSRRNELATVVKPRPRGVNQRARKFAFTSVKGSHKYPPKPPGAQPGGLLYFRESFDAATRGTVVTECELANRTVNRRRGRGPRRNPGEKALGLSESGGGDGRSDSSGGLLRVDRDG